MNPVRGIALSLSLTLATTLTASAQMTREQIEALHAKHPGGPPPSNLRVLPKDINAIDLVETMVRFSEGLGVQCTYCHVYTPDHKRLDFASDANPMKAKARVMLRMTSDIDSKYLAELPAPHSGTPPGCGTCHQGQAVPAAYKPPAGYVLE